MSWSLFQQLRFRSGIIIHRPGIRQRAIDADEIGPTTAKAPQYDIAGDAVATFLDPRCNSFQSDLRRVDLEIDDLDPVSGRLPSCQGRGVGASAERRLNAKLAPAAANRSISARNTCPAVTAAISGFSAESPAAMRSALTNWTTSGSFGRNSRAKVVLPAPLGPAMITQRAAVGEGLLVLIVTGRLFQSRLICALSASDAGCR
jgi:hypothetical protein